MYRIEAYNLDRRSRPDFLVAVKYGRGKVIGVGTRKVFEHDCFSNPNFDNDKLFRNCVEWLLQP